MPETPLTFYAVECNFYDVEMSGRGGVAFVYAGIATFPMHASLRYSREPDINNINVNIDKINFQHYGPKGRRDEACSTD
jgi:hypothetical protein